jgi:hypothetical protein
MKTNTGYHLQGLLNRSCRNPVITAMMVTGLIVGVTGSVAGVAVSRARSQCEMAESVVPPNAPEVVIDPAIRRDLPMEGAPHAELVADTAQDDVELSHGAVSAGCGCATPTAWHWQLI